MGIEQNHHKSVKMILDKTRQIDIKNSAGYSLIEMVIASLLFAIILLGLTHYQQALLTKHHLFYDRLKAERLAFQLLEIYPDNPSIIPSHWQYQITNNFYTDKCKITHITITLSNKQKIEQKRLFCESLY